MMAPQQINISIYKYPDPVNIFLHSKIRDKIRDLKETSTVIVVPKYNLVYPYKKRQRGFEADTQRRRHIKRSRQCGPKGRD